MPECVECRKSAENSFSLEIGKKIFFRFFTENYPQKISKLIPKSGTYKLQGVKVHGKYTRLLLEKDGQNYSLVYHFGMNGMIKSGKEKDKHTYFIAKIKDENKAYRFVDNRKIGFIDFFRKKINLTKRYDLGIDPLDYERFQDFYDALPEIKSRKNLSMFLLDQKPICGIGNYLRCEILFKLRYSPERTFKPKKKIYKAIHKVVWNFYNSASGNLDQSYSKGMRFKVYNQKYVIVKGKQYNVETIKKSGRTIHFCPELQK